MLLQSSFGMGGHTGRPCAIQFALDYLNFYHTAQKTP